jgi:hypothetical protein
MPAPPPDDARYLDLADYLWLAGAALNLAPTRSTRPRSRTWIRRQVD